MKTLPPSSLRRYLGKVLLVKPVGTDAFLGVSYRTYNPAFPQPAYMWVSFDKSQQVLESQIEAFVEIKILAKKLFVSKEKLKSRTFISGQSWRTLRHNTLQARGKTCEYCGRKAPHVVLHVDHIKPISKYPELRLEPSNLQVLCEDCNFGKGTQLVVNTSTNHKM